MGIIIFFFFWGGGGVGLLKFKICFGVCLIFKLTPVYIRLKIDLSPLCHFSRFFSQRFKLVFKLVILYFIRYLNW